MLVYGKNVAKEILKSDIKVRKVFFQEDFNDNLINSLVEKKKLEVKICRKKEIDDLVNGPHQGIILDIPDYKYTNIDELISTDPEFVVILDHIEDPHNLGAIIRTSEAAGVDAIILPKDRSVLVNSTVMKTSAGALVNMNVTLVTNLASTIKKLKDNGFWVIGTSLKDSKDYREIDYSGKVALVIGNEGKGMSNIVEKECDFIANIPMKGKINSLNASVASGIMIYEVVRNRK